MSVRFALRAAICAALFIIVPAPAGATGMRLSPDPDGGLVCIGTVRAEGITFTCDDVRALAEARARGDSTGATLPLEVEQLVSRWASALTGGGR